MKHSLLETAIGAMVLGAALIFLIFSYSTAHQGEGGVLNGTYRLSAAFDNIGGLRTGDAVMISGVKVGAVNTITLDDKLYRAVVEFDMTDTVKLAVDSSARIASESLLGGKYLDIQPGGDDTNLQNGDKITLTQGASNLEDLLGRFIFSANKSGGENDAATSETSAPSGDLPLHP
jgi:phospholipid/cholesterol/gamma-HCH transport system substrate-binding protein